MAATAVAPDVRIETLPVDDPQERPRSVAEEGTRNMPDRAPDPKRIEQLRKLEHVGAEILRKVLKSPPVELRELAHQYRSLEQQLAVRTSGPLLQSELSAIRYARYDRAADAITALLIECGGELEESRITKTLLDGGFQSQIRRRESNIRASLDFNVKTGRFTRRGPVDDPLIGLSNWSSPGQAEEAEPRLSSDDFDTDVTPHSGEE